MTVDLDGLFRDHAIPLLRLVVVLMGDRALAAELVQEAVVRASRTPSPPTGRTTREGWCAAPSLGARLRGVLLLGILAFGFLCGWLAQIILGLGTRPDGRTLAAGLLGSLVGGLIGSLLAGDGLALKPSGLIGSIVGAIVVLAIWSRVSPAATRR